MEQRLKHHSLVNGTLTLTGLHSVGTTGSFLNPEFEYIAKDAKRKMRTERVKQRIAIVRNEEQYLYSDPLDAYAGPHMVEAYGGATAFTAAAGTGPGGSAYSSTTAAVAAAAGHDDIEHFWSEEDEIEDDIHYDSGHPAGSDSDHLNDDAAAGNHLYSDAETQHAINKITDQMITASAGG